VKIELDMCTNIGYNNTMASEKGWIVKVDGKPIGEVGGNKLPRTTLTLENLIVFPVKELADLVERTLKSGFNGADPPIDVRVAEIQCPTNILMIRKKFWNEVRNPKTPSRPSWRSRLGI
jgi:hypothetical protein